MRIWVAGLAAVLVLGACTSEPSPREPTVSTATTATPTPTAAAPTMPSQAREDSPEGAAAFVGYYVEVFNYAAATGDVDELSRLSSPDCEGCQRYITLYRDTYAAGGYFKGKQWAPSDIKARPETSAWVVLATISSPAGKIRIRHDASEQDGEPVDAGIGFRISRSAPSQVLEIGIDGAQK